MKKLLLSLAVVAMGFAASAQISVGAMGGVALPMGDMKDVAKMKMGFGGGVAGAYALNENMSAGLSIGFYSFTSEVSSDFTLTALPILGNFTYYLMTDGFKPFLTADVGLGMMTAKSSFFGVSTETKENAFGYGIGAGAAYGISDQLDVFGSVKYSSYATTGSATTWIPITVGVMYKLGN